LIETKRETPRIKVLIYFGYHAGKEDAEKLGKHIEKFRPHVLALEGVGLTPRQRTEGFAKLNR